MSDAGSGRRIVDGRFELEARLGGGGMGTVWRARDLLLQRSVAVKEVRPPDADPAEYDPDGARMLRERVLREARALARVEHPNVVTIHHIVDGGEATYPWIVMELVEGGSLADRLGRGPMAAAEAARLGREVLSALRTAHAAGVQHRDVKPANVLLRRDGRPVLTDFGIAAIRGSSTLTATGAIIGTPDYMAPERVSGNPGGPDADLWSLAMMLYVAVEGHHPLRRGTTLATLAAVLHDDVPPPVQAGPLTPLLTQVLVRDPAARPDAEAVDRMLAAAAEADTASTPTSYPLAPPVPPATASGFGTHASTAAPRPTDPGKGRAQPTREPMDAVPFPPAGTTVGAGTPGAHTSAQRPRRQPRRTRSTVVVCCAAGAILAGGLIWGIPGGQHNGAAVSLGASQRNTSGPTAANSSPADSGTSEKPADLLTPGGIRSAIKAIEKKTGRHSFGAFSVYPGYVSASVMVAGSRTQYDTYTYRTDRGVEKGIITGSLSGGDQPVSLKNFNWDALPTLLTRAEKKLNVDKPTSRYLLVRQPNTTFDPPAGMAVYLSNDHQQSGYLEADTHGNVTKVMPYDG
ncbi:protein kinase [Streptomyces sp. NPDC001634]|uniref:serine/threonine-protein kinase n=1 Tax=Streptomyces sp. NPDC001634 TaxID=3154390 RepID=UPI00331C4104